MGLLAFFSSVDDLNNRSSDLSRRFSLPFSRNTHDHNKPALSTVQEQSKKSNVSAALLKRAHLPSSQTRAKRSALLLRQLIVGPSGTSSNSKPAPPQITSAHARPQLNKLKTELMEPKSANKVIAQLRALPVPAGHQSASDTSMGYRGPIHAVCLAQTDEDIVKLHFSTLTLPNKDSHPFLDGLASLNEVSEMFNKMDIVNLISVPGFGLGQPGDGEGLLAGAVPTAETVLKGVEEITPQLMALGYATGRTILVDHKGVYPPTDRMSVLTYWWGLELVLPPPSLQNLAQTKSIAGTVINFLTALSLINNGVKEILPFVRYMGQFVDWEFDQILRQDKGMGVVCAATWIMPAALCPRPWDFPIPPPSTSPVSPPSTTAPPQATPTPTPSSPSSSTPTPSSASPQPLPILTTSVVEASESKASVTFAAEVAPASLSNPAAKAGSVKA